MSLILIGKIAKPQGIRGELKIQPIADSPEVFDSLKKVYIDGTAFKIYSARITPGGVYLVLGGIADRNAAETYRGKSVYAEKDDIPLPEDRWFIEDVIDCAVSFENQEPLGKITDIVTRGGTDFYTVKTDDGKIVSFPFLKDMVVEVNVSSKRIIIKKEKFDEVAFYED